MVGTQIQLRKTPCNSRGNGIGAGYSPSASSFICRESNWPFTATGPRYTPCPRSACINCDTFHTSCCVKSPPGGFTTYGRCGEARFVGRRPTSFQWNIISPAAATTFTSCWPAYLALKTVRRLACRRAIPAAAAPSYPGTTDWCRLLSADRWSPERLAEFWDCLSVLFPSNPSNR